MAPTLSYPLRLDRNGSFATVDQDSVDADGELLACLILTRRGERQLQPAFGITDPTFTGFEPTEVLAQVAQWGPDITIDDLTVTPETDTVQRVDIEFQQA